MIYSFVNYFLFVCSCSVFIDFVLRDFLFDFVNGLFINMVVLIVEDGEDVVVEFVEEIKCKGFVVGCYVIRNIELYIEVVI